MIDPLSEGSGKLHADALAQADARAQPVQATLVRPDGSARYGPSEHRERHAAALAAFDADAARVTAAAATARAAAETVLTRLDGADPVSARCPSQNYAVRPRSRRLLLKKRRACPSMWSRAGCVRCWPAMTA